MTHLPYIVAAYVIAIGVPLLFSVEARKSWVEPDIKPLPF